MFLKDKPGPRVPLSKSIFILLGLTLAACTSLPKVAPTPAATPDPLTPTPPQILDATPSQFTPQLITPTASLLALPTELPPPTEQAVTIIRDVAPQWSPDGSFILFTSNRSNPGNYEYQLWRVNSDGTDLKQITSEGMSAWAKWSPQGDKIVFERSVEGPERYANKGFYLSYNIGLMNPDGNEQQLLLPDGFNKVPYNPAGLPMD